MACGSDESFWNPAETLLPPKDWIDRGGSMGCETPETACNGAMDELMAWPKASVLPPESFPKNSNPPLLHVNVCGGNFGTSDDRAPQVQCLQKKDGFACTLASNHTGSHKAYGIDELIREWPSSTDPINHPPHYTFGKIEVISVIEDWGLSFHLAQVVKYVARSKHKGNELEDLRKAQFYLNRLVTSLEKK